MTTALIMSGGQSRRMRESFGPEHKALVRVLGETLVGRNVACLLRRGFRRILISVAASESRLLKYLEDQVTPVVEAQGGSVECLVERTPLGTIGVAKQVNMTGPLLVVNVDNLTTLDLRALVLDHVARSADLTIAVHEHLFRIPFGQVVLDSNNEVTEYREKPVLPLLISSGTYVLGDGAREVISDGVCTDITHVFASLREKGGSISAFPHQADWIDVNDCAAIEQAEHLVMQNPDYFEHALPPPPDRICATHLDNP